MSPNSLNDFPFGDLPADLAPLLFQTAAELDGELGRSCALLSKKINSWVEPILYRTLVIRKRIQLSNLCRLVRYTQAGTSSKSPQFFALHVETLAIVCDTFGREAVRIMEACRSLQTLVFWYEFFDYETFEAFINTAPDNLSSLRLSPRRLSIRTASYPPSELQLDSDLRFSDAVTHLDLSWSGDFVVPEKTQALRHLTHLAISPSPRFVRPLLSRCSRTVRVIVIWVDGTKFSHLTPATRNDIIAAVEGDDRGVIGVKLRANDASLASIDCESMVVRSREDLLQDFLGTGARQDFWNQAEDVIEARRRRRQPSASVSDDNVQL